MGDVYSAGNNHQTAMIIIIRLLLCSGNPKFSQPCFCLSNAGDEFAQNKNYDSALLYFKESKVIFDKVELPKWQRLCLGNIGVVYANIGKNDLARKTLTKL